MRTSQTHLMTISPFSCFFFVFFFQDVTFLKSSSPKLLPWALLLASFFWAFLLVFLWAFDRLSLPFLLPLFAKNHFAAWAKSNSVSINNPKIIATAIKTVELTTLNCFALVLFCHRTSCLGRLKWPWVLFRSANCCSSSSSSCSWLTQ